MFETLIGPIRTGLRSFLISPPLVEIESLGLVEVYISSPNHPELLINIILKRSA